MLFQAFPYFPDNQPEMYSSLQNSCHATGRDRQWPVSTCNKGVSIVLQPHSTSKPPPTTACCMTTVLQTAVQYQLKNESNL